LGSSLPPAELARRDSALFGEVKRLFSIAPKVGKETEANGGHCVHRTLHRTLHRTRSLCDRRVRSVSSDCACFGCSIGREARPVTGHRTRPVVQGAYWTPTGRGHCGVRSVHQRVRSLVRFARLGVDRRVRSVTGPARPVVTSASGRCDRRVRSVFQKVPLRDRRVRSLRPARPVSVAKLAVARPARPVSWTSASGQRDFGCFKFLTAIFEGVRL
jgi:hypothetical protein